MEFIIVMSHGSRNTICCYSITFLYPTPCLDLLRPKWQIAMRFLADFILNIKQHAYLIVHGLYHSQQGTACNKQSSTCIIACSNRRRGLAAKRLTLDLLSSYVSFRILRARSTVFILPSSRRDLYLASILLTGV